MEVQLKPGRYVVAVSGGVDSLALLHLLYAQNWAARQAGQPTSKLIVAHYDHGIREDSVADRKLVQATAKAYGLPFVYNEGRLGAGVSEATARDARYGFLRQVHQASGTQAIITAHHLDDVLETAILNLLRGTGRRGLTSLRSHEDIHRPLLHLPKQALVDYAHSRGLRWREDSTNGDDSYLRNYIRHRILPRFDAAGRQRLGYILSSLQTQNRQLDNDLINLLHQQSMGGTLDRTWFNHLPHSVAKEALSAWLRAHGVSGFDSKALERLVVAAKTARPGKLFPLLGGRQMHVGSLNLALVGSER